MITQEFGHFIQLIVNGLALGTIYSIVALGFVLVYKATDIFNFAQGELMILGAFLCYSFVTHFHVHFIWAFLLNLIAMGLIGLLTEEVIFKPIIGEPLFAVIMATVGLSVLLRGVIGLSWGYMMKEFPAFVSEAPISFSGIILSPAHLITIIITSSLVLLFALFFKFSKLGIAMKAVASDLGASLLMGISPRKIFGVTWAIAAAVASIGGILLASITYLHPSLSSVGIKVFPAVVLGGLDSVPGAIIGGVIIGIVENIAGGYLDPIIGGGVKEITAFAVLIAIMMIKPYGLFGKEKIERV